MRAAVKKKNQEQTIALAPCFFHMQLFIVFYCHMLYAMSSLRQAQRIAFLLVHCVTWLFLNGQPFHLAALKKAFTRIGTAFVRGLGTDKNKNST
jgi:hypothetical protein